MLVAAPLLVLGAPHALWARQLARPLRVLGVLTWWPIAWTLFAAAAVGIHLTGLFDLALDHPWVHALEHVALLVAGLVFWFPVLAAPPAPRRLGPVARTAYLLGGMAPMGVLGAIVASTNGRLYTHYSVADQANAGAVMWVASGWALVVATVGAAWAGMVAEERRQLRREQVAGRRSQGGGA
jgi:cytochrome c oxidase assembly factor CtaG